MVLQPHPGMRNPKPLSSAKMCHFVQVQQIQLELFIFHGSLTSIQSTDLDL